LIQEVLDGRQNSNLKLQLQNVESKRQGAKIAKGFIIENKRFLSALALFAVQKTRDQFHSLNGPAAAGRQS